MPRRSALSLLAVAAQVLGVGAAAPALAQDYLITVSGPYRSFTNDGGFYDGTNNGELGPIYNIPRLTGGTFSATFRFQAVTNPPPGNFAGYTFTQPAGLTYDLLDSTGTLVHRGTSPSSAGATVGNNFVSPVNTIDTVGLYSFVNSITGLVTPTPLYSATGDIGSLQSRLGFNGGVGPSNSNADYITDLSVPLSASTFLSFPNRTFTAGAYFGDGDFVDFIDPYQYVETSVTYGITSVSVTQIPTPSAAAVFGLSGLIAVKRRRRCYW